MHDDSGNIVFLGDSITEFLDVDEYLPAYHIISRPNTEILSLNREIAAIAEEKHCTFIDIYPLLLDSGGELAEEYTIDGLHLSAAAMAKWTAHLVPYLDE